MTHLSIHLLGSFHVTLDGAPVTGFESKKVRALLAYLAVEADRPHSRDKLTGLLWPDQPERTARRNLSQALFNLRRSIRDDGANPPFLHITRRTVQFNHDSDYWLDAADFESQIGGFQSVPGDPASQIQKLRSAIDLYHGDFLAGFFVDDSLPFGEWASIRRERFHQQALDALNQLAHHCERHRNYRCARHYACRQVELEPWREEAHRQLMRVLARSGQRSAALAQYERCRQILADELGIEPTETTKRLYRRIGAVPKIGVHNLPPQTTPFVGRAEKLRDIGRRLTDPDCRLLTLVGPGGIGKTRLAIQAAYESRRLFLHGVCFVSLTSLQTAEFLVSVIASALQLHPSELAPKAQLLDFLRERELLLVLDNFEHLIPDGAGLLTDILRAAPEVKLLVTSRERLNLYGETVLGIEGLALPSRVDVEDFTSYGAVDLFLQIADRVQVGFTPSDDRLSEVVRICRLVEGMPLGIELAASWTHAFSCQMIADRIEENLAFLSTSMQGMPSRHQSVQAAFDHSWQRLTLEEQSVFERLSVFRGGFEDQAAAQVISASSMDLTNLVNRSFLTRTSAGRYEVHELMRQYGAEKLASDSSRAESTHEAHCRYYARFFHDASKRFRAGQQREALGGMEPEAANVHAAWRWAIDQMRCDELEKLMIGVYVFYENRGQYREGYALLEKATSPLEQAIVGRAGSGQELGCLLGKLLWRQGDLFREFETVDERPETVALLRRSVTLLRTCDDERELVESLGVLGNVLRKHGQATEAKPLLEESVGIARQLEDQVSLAWALDNLGLAYLDLGHLDKAQQLFQKSLAIHRECNYLKGMAHNLNNLGLASYLMEHYHEAKQRFLESRDVFDELGNPARVAMTIHNVGEVCRLLDEDEAAAQYQRDALRIVAAGYGARLPINVLLELARLSKKKGQWTQAYELAFFVKHHPLTEQPVYRVVCPFLAELEPKLSKEITTAAQTRAAAWTLDDVVAEVLAYDTP